MGFELVVPKAEKEKPVAIMDIICNGRLVGEIRKYISDDVAQFHCIINLESDAAAFFRSGLVQGHGDTWNNALENAFERSRNDAESYLASLEAMRLEMFTDEVAA